MYLVNDAMYLVAHQGSNLLRSLRVKAEFLSVALGLACLGAGPAQAQDLVHRFVDPSFGGNPFYSDHLLAIANIDRPTAPTTPITTPTQEELLAQQLQARLLSQLSGNILDQIQNAAVGDTGNFAFGNQQVSFVRSSTDTRVTFTNTTTGVTNTVVLPSAASASGTSAASPSTFAATAAPSATLSAEQSLGASGRIAALGATGQAGGTSPMGVSAEQMLSGSVTGSVLPPF